MFVSLNSFAKKTLSQQDVRTVLLFTNDIQPLSKLIFIISMSIGWDVKLCPASKLTTAKHVSQENVGLPGKLQ